MRIVVEHPPAADKQALVKVKRSPALRTPTRGARTLAPKRPAKGLRSFFLRCEPCPCRPRPRPPSAGRDSASEVSRPSSLPRCGWIRRPHGRVGQQRRCRLRSLRSLRSIANRRIRLPCQTLLGRHRARVRRLPRRPQAWAAAAVPPPPCRLAPALRPSRQTASWSRPASAAIQCWRPSRRCRGPTAPRRPTF